MRNILKYFISLTFLFQAFLFEAQSNYQNSKTHPVLINSKIFTHTNDPFGCRVFIENKGQFKDIQNTPVLYALENGFERIYFTQKGLFHVLSKEHKITKHEQEELEKGKITAFKPNETDTIYMSWLSANASLSIVASEKQTHYFTYGEAALNANTYNKLIYKNVYNGIDIEYTIPKEKSKGIKYSLIIHPGANPEDVQIAYTGDLKSIKMKESEMIIHTSVDDLIEHVPYSFNQDGSEVISKFSLNNNIISFQLPEGYNQGQTLTIDPWVTNSSTLTTNSYAYDIDYDFLGNTYIYGGAGPYKVACYSNAGTLQWVFGGIITSISWTSANYAYPSNFGVDRFLGKTYIGQGYNGNGNLIVRLDAFGNYDNFVCSQNNQFREVWDMGFHCLTAEVFVLGGGTSSNICAVTMNTVTGALTLSTFQPTYSATNQDILSHAIDDAGNIFVIYAGPTGVNNKICFVNSSFNGNVWTQPSSFTSFNELANKGGYSGGGSIISNGFNCLAVNANYVYYYDGYNLGAYDKTTGTVVATTNISGHTVKRQGGIAVDDCNNLYLGGDGNIVTYSFNGTAFTPSSPIPLNVSSTYQYVYDIKLDKQTKVLYVCGSDFVGTYSPVNTLACQTASSLCLFSQGGISVNTTSITCSGLGSATCSAVGTNGPFTYTWLPSMQSGSVATGLTPGSHQIVVHNLSNNQTYTSTAYLAPLVQLTASVTNPVILNCNGVNNGTAAVTNLIGGSGHQSYLWTNGTNTQSTSLASGLGIGNYTVTVTDSISACIFKQITTVTQPPPLTSTLVSNSATACANTSVTLISQTGGGSPNYTYSWVAGPSTGSFFTTQSSPGPHTYTLITTDSKTCSITKTISVNFINTPTLSLSSVSICPFQTATLNVTGANSYLWNNSSSGNSFTASPLSTTLYTVVGTGSICSTIANVSIVVNPIPTPTLSSNSPVCSGQQLNLSVSGGASSIWEGPLGFTANVLQPSINNVSTGYSGIYSSTVTGANSCTAAATVSVLVRPNPVISASGSTVCATQTAGIFATSNSSPCVFQWFGPNAFNSLQQNILIQNPVPAQSGNYSLTVIDANGCYSKAVAHLTVTAMPIPSFVSTSPKCFGETLSFNASASSGAIFYQWSGPNGFLSTIQNPSIPAVTLPANGDYTLVIIAGPCITQTIQQVIIHSLPTLAITGSPSVCDQSTLSLFVTASGNVTSFAWMDSTGVLSHSAHLLRSPALLHHSGIYTISVKDANNCVNTDILNVDILPNPALSVANVTVCLNESALLLASGANTYFWTGPSFYQSSAQNALISKANTNTQGTYTLVGTGMNGCKSKTTASVSYLNLPKPELTIAPGPTICVNTEIHFKGYGGSAYQWRGPNLMYFEGKDLNLKLSGLHYNGNYTLTVIDDNGCRASKDTSLLIHPLPSVSFTGDKMEDCVPFCSDYSYTSASSHSISSLWYINSEVLSGKTFNRCFSVAGKQDITGVFSDLNTSCTSTFNFVILAHPKPIADFTYNPDIITENSDEVIFTSTSQGEELSKFNWYLNTTDGLTMHGKEMRYTFEQEGIYPVVLLTENKWGCADTAIKAIQVDPDFTIFVPNVFTPNDDNRNDIFLPICRAVKLYQLSVFDRWGKLLFETSDSNQGWDGKYRGEMCKDDSYVWKILITSIHGKQKELSGNVSIIK